MWAIRVSAAYILAYPIGLGPIGVWIAMVSDWCVRGICYTVRWLRGHWQEQQIIEN
jgi:Na+-driven multidrug efflux pump